MKSCLELSFTVRIPTAIVPRAIKIMSQKYGDFDEYSTILRYKCRNKKPTIKNEMFCKRPLCTNCSSPKTENAIQSINIPTAQTHIAEKTRFFQVTQYRIEIKMIAAVLITRLIFVFCDIIQTRLPIK